jgi:D-inositol-3-phosphate glycosyltransferase
MKIALIDPVGGKMGMNHYDDGLMHGLSGNGFKSFIFSNYKSRYNEIDSKLFFDNVNKNRLQSAWNNLTGMIRTVFFCRKEKMNCIIFHIFRGGLFDLFSLLLVKTYGLKLLLIIHDIETIDTKTYKSIKRIVLSKFHDILVVHNRFSQEKIKEFTGKHFIKNIHIIPHGNYGHFSEKACNREQALNYFQLDPSQHYMLFFGQVKKTKGLDVLLEAMYYSKSNFKLIIAGKLRIKNFDIYQNIIDRYNLHDRVIKMLRFITDEDAYKLFFLSDAIVLPYRNIYQSGVLLLAMSLGKTVIVSDLEPFKELILHGVNGLLFEQNNAQLLAELIDEVHSKKFDIHIIGNTAKKFAEKNFSWDNISKSFRDVLRLI